MKTGNANRLAFPENLYMSDFKAFTWKYELFIKKKKIDWKKIIIGQVAAILIIGQKLKI